MRFYLLLLLCTSIFSQNKTLSTDSQISILTCGPGVNELYSYFGHSAIRIKDAKNHIDKVYNYGMFDFDTPNFYLKFCRGQLLYQVSSYPYKYFPYAYAKDKRWITAQILNLDRSQNQQIFDFLEWNILPENKKYHYDFFYDNCATKIHEVLEKSIGNITYDFSSFPKQLTHRDLIHRYLPKNSWSKFGIDLALGAVIDKQATLKQYLFLPDFVKLGISNATLKNKPLIKTSKSILKDYSLQQSVFPFILSPFVISLLLFASVLYLFFRTKHSIWFNSISVLIGFTGILLFLLWFFTEHSTTKNNMNLLWANPLLILLPFVRNQLKKVISYIGILSLMGFIVVGITKYQVFNTSFYILALSVTLLYLKIVFPLKKNY